MKLLKGILFLAVALIVIGLFMGVYYVLGWVLSLLLNPVLLHFNLNPITPFLGALMLILIDWFIRLIRK